MWLTEGESGKLIGRSPVTLHDWRRAGLVVARKRRQSWEFDRASLLRARSRMEWLYAHRRIVPGTGRGRRVDWSVMIPLWEEEEK